MSEIDEKREALRLMWAFNQYFASANDVDVPERITVKRDEWRALRYAMVAALTSPAPVPDAELAGARSAVATLSALVDESTDMLTQMRALVGDLHRHWSPGGAPERGEFSLLDRVDDWLSARPEPTAAPVQDDVVPLLARHISEWHEDDGPVMWWAWSGDRREWAGEPAWIGSPLSEDWPGYHTHWTPHPKMPSIDAALSAAKAGGAE